MSPGREIDTLAPVPPTPSLFTRRRFLRLLGQGALVAAVPAPSLPAASADANAVTLSILHTTDLHGHILPTVDYHAHPDLGGLARCATQIRAWQSANSHWVLLDIGDVYQGTAVSLASQGALMIRLLNALNYDAWVVGNHEFDWGTDTFAARVAESNMPVLSGNALIAGQTVGTATDSAHPLSRLRPWIIKEVAGFRIAIVGLTTPALSTWLPPENLRGFEPLDPVESLRTILTELAPQKPDAIVLAGHMGLIRKDDFANQIGALTLDFPQLTVCIGAHTHQDHSGEWINGVLYTQADHYGIHVGKVDLTFDRATRKLLRHEAVTVLMDHQVAFDPQVMSLAQNDLAAADQLLARKIGELTEPFRASTVFGQPGEQERLIASAMLAALRQKGGDADVVLHGLFDDTHDLAAGPVTVGDAWRVLLYENQIVTVDISGADLLAVAQEVATAKDLRQLMGLQVAATREGAAWKVTGLKTAAGAPLSDAKLYRVALNSYDSQSGGGRLPLLAQLVAAPSSHRVLHPVETRDALIDFFTTRGKVGRGLLLV